MFIVNWKAVELQVALPRTQDVGRIQEQIQQRGQFMQEVIAQNQLQSEELKRRSVTNLEEGHKLKNNKDKSEHENQPNQKVNSANQQPEPEQSKKVPHPYLGTRIDING